MPDDTIVVDRAYLKNLENLANAVDVLVEANVVVRQTGAMGGGGNAVSHAMNEAWIATMRLRRMWRERDDG